MFIIAALAIWFAGGTFAAYALCAAAHRGDETRSRIAPPTNQRAELAS